MDPSICMTCGIEWSSNQKLHRKVNILKNQYGILTDQLFRLNRVNQFNELRIKNLCHERENYIALSESSKEAAAGLQRHFEDQQLTFEIERKERAHAMQSESARREATERSLEHERAVVQQMTGILNKFEFPSGEGLSIDIPDDIGLGKLFHEWESMKSEVGDLRKELQRTAAKLQRKQLVLDNLSNDFEIEPQSMSETSFSDSDEEDGIGVTANQTTSRSQRTQAGVAREE